MHTRRAILGQSLAWAATAAAGVLPQRAVAAALPRALTAWKNGDTYYAGLWSPSDTPKGVQLPARAHQLLALPRPAQAAGQSSRESTGLQALVLARRPGEYLLRMDVLRGHALQWHRMEDDRYLGGHAVLSACGGRFYTTETDGDSGQGLIVERDLQSLAKLREFPSGGIGPHAVLLEPTGTLLVANGGILNLPETGRRKLNIGTMDSNLTRLAPGTGQVLQQYRLSDPWLSLRHLAAAPDGRIAVALQAEHPDRNARATAPALALLHHDALHAVAWPADTGAPVGWDGYAGDVCYVQQRFWISATQAGWLASWSATGEALMTQPLAGAGALAVGGTHWLAAGTHTALWHADGQQPTQYLGLKYPWDNHATLV